MTYRLAFVRTNDGNLKITASAKGKPSLAVTYFHPDVFVAACLVTNLPEQIIYDVRNAAERAWAGEGMDVCCEPIEVEPDQVHRLGLRDPDSEEIVTGVPLATTP